MRKYFFILLFLPFACSAQIVTNFAGGGISVGDGGLATAASIPDPAGMRFDKNGNLYIASGVDGRIRKIDKLGIITTVAGSNTTGYSGDGGPATAAKIKFAVDLAFDAVGNLFFSDAQINVIRRVDAVTGIITTICGDGTMGSTGDNWPASAATLYGPSGICFDKGGNLYVGSNDHKVRKISTSGIITTVAGTGVAGYNGDNVAATTAQLYYPVSVQADEAGNIYISDQGNYRVRKINTSGIITTYAGNGNGAYLGDGIPATNAQFTPVFITFSLDGALYVSGIYRIFQIDKAGIFHTVAGNGAASNMGDGGSALLASFDAPIGLAFDSCNNLYISVKDYNRIRKVGFNPLCWKLDVENEQPTTKAYSIYPNPANDELHIDNVEGKASYCILAITGQTIQQGTVHNVRNVINVGNIANGMYLLSVTDEQGKRMVSKFVKQ